MSKRKKLIRLNTPGQIELTKSPLIIAIIQYLRHHGPATVSEIGIAIGKKPNSLHYHVRRLAKNGLVHTVGSTRSGARTVSIVDVTANRFEGSNIRSNRKIREVTINAAAAVLRLAGREYAQAAKRPEQLCEIGAACNIAVQRNTARLTKAQLAEANKHLSALRKLFTENIGSTSGQMIAMTIAMMPIEDEFPK